LASLDHLLDAAVGTLYFSMLLGRPPDPAWIATLANTLLDRVRAR
jgi:hypothetical protein